MDFCRFRPGRVSASTSTKTLCARLTRTRMPGATRSGARRTGASRSGELLRYAADAALGDTVVALEFDVVELMSKLLDFGVRLGQVGPVVPAFHTCLFFRQFAEVADRQAPA